MEALETPAVTITPEPTADELLDKGLDAALDKLAAEPELVKPAEVKPGPKPEDKVDGDKVNGNGALTDEDKQILADVRAGKVIPKHRLDEVLERTKLYEAFGSPEELADKLKKLSVPGTKSETTELTDEEKEMQAVFLKLFPHLGSIPKTVAEFEKFKEESQRRSAEEESRKEAEFNVFTESAANHVRELAEKAGYNVKDAEVFADLMAVIRNRLETGVDLNDPKTFTETFKNFYHKRDVKVIDSIFDAYHKKFSSGIQRQTQADILKSKKKEEGLPKAPARGGALEQEKPKNPAEMEWSDIGEAAFERMQSE